MEVGMGTRCVSPVWVDHRQFNQTYSISHLHPIVQQHTFPARPAPPGRPGIPATTFPIRIHFSHHCFTVAIDAVQRYLDEEVYEDLTRNEVRIFNEGRWTLSKGLPAILQQALAKQVLVYQTRHQNYVVVDVGAASPAYYRIYFSVGKWAVGGGVLIQVESAYPTSDSPLGIGSGHKHKSINAVLAGAL